MMGVGKGGGMISSFTGLQSNMALGRGGVRGKIKPYVSFRLAPALSELLK